MVNLQQDNEYPLQCQTVITMINFHHIDKVS